MRFKTYLHPNSRFQLSDKIVKFENGIYETNDKKEIEELKKVSSVFIDEAEKDISFKAELENIKKLNNEETDILEDDVIEDVSSVKKAGRPKKQ